MDYYKIAIVAKSGGGKTYSFRNMDPLTTGYINVEKKPLPFINKFKFYSTPKDWQEAYRTLIEYAKNPEIKQIVFDSFSEFQDSLLRSCRKSYKGFEIWNVYNTEIANLLELINLIQKEVLMSAHYDIVDVDGGSYSEKRIGVKGKEHNTVGIEKNFTMVVFGDISKADEKREFKFNLISDGNNSAKTPPFIIDALGGADSCSNDSWMLLQTIRETLTK